MINRIKKTVVLVAIFIVPIHCSAQQTMKILCVADKTFNYAHSSFTSQIIALSQKGHCISIYMPDGTPGVWEWANYYKSGEIAYDNKLLSDLSVYDIIYCENGVLGKKMARIKKDHDSRVPLVTCFLGPDITSDNEIKKSSYDQLFTQGNFFLPTCEYVNIKLESRGLASDKMSVVCPGIDCDLFKFRLKLVDYDKEIRLIAVGNFDYVTNMACVVRAFNSVAKTYPMSSLTLVGDGILLPEIKLLIEKLGIGSKVKLVGKLRQHELINMLTQSHIFLYGSSTQQNGLQQGAADTVKQAMAIGLPVVAAHHGGILDLIQDSVTGMLVPENDHDKLASKVKFLIKNHTKWPKIVLEARYKILKYVNAQESNNRLEKILLTLINEN